MRTSTLVTKLAALSVIVAITYWFYYKPDDWMLPLGASALMVMIGLSSFYRRFTVEGHADKPPILPLLSVMCLLGPVALFQVLPYELRTAVSVHAQKLDGSNVALYFLVGLVMAIWIWTPFVSYRLIDRIMNVRTASKPA